MMNSGRIKARREFLRKAALLGGAGIGGAALMGGLDRSVLAAPPSGAVGYINQWQNLGRSSCVVFVDSGGSYYVKDTGIGADLGDIIVNANVITAYGASLGAGTAGASTTTAGIQEAVNCLRVTGGSIFLAPGLYNVTPPITSYPWIEIFSTGQLALNSATGQGGAVLSPGSTNQPVIKVQTDTVNDPSGTRTFFNFHDFMIIGSTPVATAQDGIFLTDVNAVIKDGMIRNVGCYELGGNGFNFASASAKVVMDNCWAETNVLNGIRHSKGLLTVLGGIYEINTQAGIDSTSSAGVVIIGPQISLNGFEGIVMWSGTNPGIVQGCTIGNNGNSTHSNIKLRSNGGTYGSYLISDNVIFESRAGAARGQYAINLVDAGIDAQIYANRLVGTWQNTPYINIPASVTSESLLRIKDNLGFNPLGLLTNPFGTAAIGANGTTAVPVASTDYLVQTMDIFVTGANSANANNAILVKDGAGNTVLGPVSTLNAQYVPVGFKINWGAFTGAAGAVSVWAN